MKKTDKAVQKKYEYKAVPVKATHESWYVDQLNEEGQLGWIYVAMNSEWITFMREFIEPPTNP